MALTEKYAALAQKAQELGIQNFQAKEVGGKLHVSGTTTYALERDLWWDALKKTDGWQTEVQADIKAERSDIHGMYTVKSGDTLSKIAKSALDDPNRYMDIFNANKDKLKDPNMIQPGQVLVIPNR